MQARGERREREPCVPRFCFCLVRVPVSEVQYISQTSPYMHDGRFKTLREVIDFYVQGGIVNSNLDPDMEKLDLTEKEKKNLESFLRTLDGKIIKIK